MTTIGVGEQLFVIWVNVRTAFFAVKETYFQRLGKVLISLYPCYRKESVHRKVKTVDAACKFSCGNVLGELFAVKINMSLGGKPHIASFGLVQPDKVIEAVLLGRGKTCGYKLLVQQHHNKLLPCKGETVFLGKSERGDTHSLVMIGGVEAENAAVGGIVCFYHAAVLECKKLSRKFRQLFNPRCPEFGESHKISVKPLEAFVELCLRKGEENILL